MGYNEGAEKGCAVKSYAESRGLNVLLLKQGGGVLNVSL